MGRPRQYTSAAARQAAYRQRMQATTMWVDREPVERIDRALDQLYEATWRASQQGNRLARALYRSTTLETLEATVAWIIQRVQQEQQDSSGYSAAGEEE